MPTHRQRKVSPAETAVLSMIERERVADDPNSMWIPDRLLMPDWQITIRMPKGWDPSGVAIKAVTNSPGSFSAFQVRPAQPAKFTIFQDDANLVAFDFSDLAKTHEKLIGVQIFYGRAALDRLVRRDEVHGLAERLT